MTWQLASCVSDEVTKNKRLAQKVKVLEYTIGWQTSNVSESIYCHRQPEILPIVTTKYTFSKYDPIGLKQVRDHQPLEVFC